MKKLQVVAGIVLTTSFVATATAETAPEAVAFDEYGAVTESLTGAAGDAAAGREALASKKVGNCLSCHVVSEITDHPFHGEIGPPLDGVADRWEEGEIRGIVANAKKTFEGTMMPAFYKTSGFIRPGDAFTGKAGTEPLPPILTAAQIEDIVAYLLTLKE